LVGTIFASINQAAVAIIANKTTYNVLRFILLLQPLMRYLVFGNFNIWSNKKVEGW
jgi:hypothetical protein